MMYSQTCPFYNEIVPDTIAENITTRTSDHLIQSLIEPSEFSKNMEKAILHIAVLSISVMKNLKNR